MGKLCIVGGTRIEITEDCIGSAQCVALAPEVFRLDDDGYAVLTDELLGPESIHRARDAEDVCPTGAVRVHTAEHEPTQSEK
jgi:ferredoxin